MEPQTNGTAPLPVPVVRGTNGRFLPGSSGNPGGRHGNRIAIGRARELSLDAINKLWEMANDKKVPPTTRKECLIAILDRGLGRPRQAPTRLEEIIDSMPEQDLIAIACRTLDPFDSIPQLEGPHVTD